MLKIIRWLKQYAKYFLAAWLLIIIIVSSTPSVPVLKIHTAKADIRLDYLFHFGEYGVLTFLTFLSFADNEFKMSYRKLILITLGLISFAILDEVHQKLIPGRSFNVKDILSNISGILAALLFCSAVFKELARKAVEDV